VSAPLSVVTGGSGYFGSVVVARLLERGDRVRVLDVNDAEDRLPDVELVRGDIRDPATVARAVAGADAVFHNVAQVPLARDKAAFRTVNVDGTRLLLDTCLQAEVGKVVHTSSSAIFGVPAANPVTEETPPAPAEDYGRAKLDAEGLCAAAVAQGLDVTIVRPRTIVGHGRLGIFSLLFDWISEDVDVFVLGAGDNRYQFVHADDMADLCLRAGERPGAGVFNGGATEFGTMRETIEGVIRHAGSGSRVRSLPMRPTVLAMRATAGLGLTPFAPYHWIMFGRSMWFDTTRAQADLDWQPAWSTEAMFAEAYDSWLASRETDPGTGSHHRRPAKAGLLGAAKAGVRLVSRGQRARST
jgi:nucleoside-diphosphate-sugar epimerase